jgi:uncharacterized protein (TIGR03086 family)
MTHVETLRFALDELSAVVASLDSSQMDTVTNCEPWTVRRLASHAVNNQLLWAGMVTGEATVSVEDTMGAVPHAGDLAVFAKDAATRALAMWSTPGVLELTHVTPFGELPGSVVILFPTVDAFVHAWDLSATVGPAIEFTPESIPTITAVVEATCTDAAREHGVIQPATEPPADATDTERLMAAAGRTVPR